MRRILLACSLLLGASAAVAGCSEEAEPRCSGDDQCLAGEVCDEPSGRCVPEGSQAVDAGVPVARDASTPPPPPPPVPDAGRPVRPDAGPLEIPDGGAFEVEVQVRQSPEGAVAAARAVEPTRALFCARGQYDSPASDVECCATRGGDGQPSYRAGDITVSAGTTATVKLEYDVARSLYPEEPLALPTGASVSATIAGHAPVPATSVGPLRMPAELKLTTPAVSAGRPALAREGFDVAWDAPAASGGRVLVAIEQVDPRSNVPVEVTCTAPDTGTFRMSTLLLRENLTTAAGHLRVERLATARRTLAGGSGATLRALHGVRVEISIR